MSKITIYIYIYIYIYTHPFSKTLQLEKYISLLFKTKQLLFQNKRYIYFQNATFLKTGVYIYIYIYLTIRL